MRAFQTLEGKVFLHSFSFATDSLKLSTPGHVTEVPSSDRACPSRPTQYSPVRCFMLWATPTRWPKL